jgi:hypothetical protein
MAKMIPILIFFAGLIGLYYLYQYLFGPQTGTSYVLLTGKQTATIDPAKPIIVTSNQLPSLFEGGEFTVSTWIYINNWSYRAGFNKAILSVGGPHFDTFRIYLGGSKPKLNIRFHTMETGTVPTTNAAQTAAQSLAVDSLSSTFSVLQTDSGLLDGPQLCDLPEVELQRWVNLTVAVNGKTVDVYLDGKLSRSCVLPSYYKVDAGGYSAKLLAYGGFGGQISTTTMYDGAQNPEIVYKNYMAGPEPITSIGGWFSTFFAPGLSINVTST